MEEVGRLLVFICCRGKDLLSSMSFCVENGETTVTEICCWWKIDSDILLVERLIAMYGVLFYVFFLSAHTKEFCFVSFWSFTYNQSIAESIRAMGIRYSLRRYD
jgi:hypothetical protein